MLSGQPKAELTQCHDLWGNGLNDKVSQPLERGLWGDLREWSERQSFATIETRNKLAFREESGRENTECVQIYCLTFTQYLGDLLFTFS